MFRNLPIRSKFVTVLSVPLIGLIILATIGINRSIQVVDRSKQTRQVAAFTDQVGELANALQLERFVTGVYLDGKQLVPLRRLQSQWSVSEDASRTLRTQSRALEVADRTLMGAALGRSLADLDQLADLRRRIQDHSVTASAPELRTYLRTEGDLATVKLLAGSATRERLNSIAEDLTVSSNRSMVYYALAVAIVLALAIGVSVPVAGSMARSLHRLRDASLEVAQRQLPGVVARLQTARSTEDLQLEAAPVAVGSRDEIGQVADAFNTVHQVAVRTAAEQAALRRSIGDMFINLARRSQSLLDRQIRLIDQLERAEEDPDALEDLFRLDHLATRMRRNAENLIVLSGAEPARRWGRPVELLRVVRAAVAEVEDYTRVEMLPLEDLRLQGQAVGDLVHLLAELIENATSFSPPETKVLVSGETVPSGYVLEIEDRGVGMSDAELASANQRLARPPMIDFALDRMLGFFVVGRLAQRYGIRVELRHSWYGGIAALVLLPARLVVRGDAAVLPEPAPVRELPEAPASRDWFERR
jgi:HAMP domain